MLVQQPDLASYPLLIRPCVTKSLSLTVTLPSPLGRPSKLLPPGSLAAH